MLHESEDFTKIHNEYNLPWSVFLGIAGLPGKLFVSVVVLKACADGIQRQDRIFWLEGVFTCEEGEVAQDVSHRANSLAQGEVAFVTSGAGAVGSYVIFP